MNKAILKLSILATLILHASCLLITMDDFYRPVYESELGRLARIDCCGGSGPDAVLVINAPKNVQLTIVMWNGEAGNKDRIIKGESGRGVFGMLGVYAPQGITITFQSSEVIFQNLLTDKEYRHKIEQVRFQHQERRSKLCPNWVTYEHVEWDEYMKSIGQGSKSPFSKFDKVFRGEGKKGSFMWVNLESGNDFGNPDRFRVLLPSISVENTEFHPAPIDFEWSAGGRYIYPLNC